MVSSCYYTENVMLKHWPFYHLVAESMLKASGWPEIADEMTSRATGIEFEGKHMYSTSAKKRKQWQGEIGALSLKLNVVKHVLRIVFSTHTEISCLTKVSECLYFPWFLVFIVAC